MFVLTVMQSNRLYFSLEYVYDKNIIFEELTLNQEESPVVVRALLLEQVIFFLFKVACFSLKIVYKIQLLE